MLIFIHRLGNNENKYLKKVYFKIQIMVYIPNKTKKCRVCIQLSYKLNFTTSKPLNLVTLYHNNYAIIFKMLIFSYQLGNNENKYSKKVYFKFQILVHKYWTLPGHFCVSVLWASDQHWHILKNVYFTFSVHLILNNNGMFHYLGSKVHFFLYIKLHFLFEIIYFLSVSIFNH